MSVHLRHHLLFLSGLLVLSLINDGQEAPLVCPSFLILTVCTHDFDFILGQYFLSLNSLGKKVWSSGLLVSLSKNVQSGKRVWSRDKCP